MSLVGLRAEKNHYREIEYSLPRLVIQIFFERLNLYWQVASSPWSVVHMSRLTLGSGGLVILFLWAAAAQAVCNAECF